jgi:hypothetical protein
MKAKMVKRRQNEPKFKSKTDEKKANPAKRKQSDRRRYRKKINNQQQKGAKEAKQEKHDKA